MQTILMRHCPWIELRVENEFCKKLSTVTKVQSVGNYVERIQFSAEYDCYISVITEHYECIQRSLFVTIFETRTARDKKLPCIHYVIDKTKVVVFDAFR